METMPNDLAWVGPKAMANPPLPDRPRYAQHRHRSRGARTSTERYALMRVGGCPEAYETRDPRDLILKMKRTLNCPVDPSRGITGHSSENDPLLDRISRQEQTIVSPVTIAKLRAMWTEASLTSDHQKIHYLSGVLGKLPIPDRARERMELSEAISVLNALNMGPIKTPSLTPNQSLERLNYLARHALGKQVRAQALEMVMQQDPHPRLRQQAHEMLWTELPQTPPAHRLIKVPQHADWFRRGQAAFKARDYQLTLGALQHFSPINEATQTLLPRTVPSAIKSLAVESDQGLVSKKSVSKKNKYIQDLTQITETGQRAALMIAISLMRLRVHPQEAENQLLRAFHGPDSETSLSAAYYQAHLMSRLKRWDESLAKLKYYITHGPRGRRKKEARYQIGRTLHQAGRYDQAIKAHQRFLETKPKDRAMYEWFLGWSYYRNGDCAQAMRVWKDIATDGNLIVGPKALYWIARCQVKMGQKSRALRTLKKLRKQSALGYYALLGQSLYARLKRRPFVWKNPLRKDRSRHWRVAANPIPMRDMKQLRNHRTTRQVAKLIKRALQLVSMGEERLARVQSHKICHGRNQRLIKKRLGKAKLYRLCDALLFYTGDHGKRWKRQASKRIGWRSGFTRRTVTERAETYPLAYYDLSVAAASVEGISPWWLMSHMLQESRYRPEVVSYAQAIGLMQILGRTGKRIHKRLEWPAGPFFSDQLYDPALSIRYAAWYLRRLSDDLGHTMLAIGAYNGGPMRFADHQDEFQGQPFDVMVEEMGAHESRNYLRKVTDHFIRYLALYASDDEWHLWTQRLAPPEYTPKAQRTVGF